MEEWIEVVKQGGAFSAGAVIVALVSKWANSEATRERTLRMQIDLKREEALLKQIAQQNDLVARMNSEKNELQLVNNAQRSQIEAQQGRIAKLQGNTLL